MNDVRHRLTSKASSQSVVLGIICLSVFSTALDQTVIVAALPLVMVDLEIPLTDLDRGLLDHNRVSGQLHRVHAVGRTSVRRLRPRQDVPGGAGRVRHWIGVCSDFAELLFGLCRPGYFRP